MIYEKLGNLHQAAQYYIPKNGTLQVEVTTGPNE